MNYGWQAASLDNMMPNMHAWLSYPSNLTAKLKTVDRHTLEVLSQSIDILPKEEKLLLQQTETTGFIRHIMHRLQSEVVIVARTVVSQKLYNCYQTIFDTLNTMPIGQTFLYQAPDIKRSDFQYGLVTFPSILLFPFTEVDKMPSPLPARRSIFTKENMRLLITEIFLPTLAHYDVV